MIAPRSSNSSEPDPAQWRSIAARAIPVPLVLALLLFLPAGDIAWTGGWVFLLVFVALSVAAVLCLRRVNPEIFAARSRMIRAGTKHWDRILLGFLIPAIVAIVSARHEEHARRKGLGARRHCVAPWCRSQEDFLHRAS